MIDPLASRRWLFRLLFATLTLAVMLILLLPLNTAPSQVPGPDLVLCLAFAWVQRRPDYVPTALLALVFLLADLLLMRPPGLWAVLALLGAEFLRSRMQGSSELPFIAEWAFTAAIIAGVMLGYWVMLTVAMVPHATPVLATMQAAMTILAYPLVVFVSRTTFNVQRITPSEMDPSGGAR